MTKLEKKQLGLLKQHYTTWKDAQHLDSESASYFMSQYLTCRSFFMTTAGYDSEKMENFEDLWRAEWKRSQRDYER